MQDETAATLRSTEEVNTTTTSYGTREPDWGGATAADVILSGAYDGSDGDDRLRFEVTQGDPLGLQDVEIDVFNGSGDLIDRLEFRQNEALMQEVGNGIIVSLDSLNVFAGDQFELDVLSSLGTSVDPNAAFNGVGNASPKLDLGQAVRAGSFTVNGEAISVNGDDSLNDVLAKITASAAGVTAAFYAATGTVSLTQTELGSAPTIAFGSDSSGFLDAAKLSYAVVTPGEDQRNGGTTDDLIEALPALGSVVSGSFTVDGIVIEVDVGVDSVSDVLGRISAASGLNATMTERGEIRVSGDRRGFELGDDSTGFLGALGIDQRRYVARGGRTGQRLKDQGGVRQALVEVRDALQNVMSGARDGVSLSSVLEVRSRVSTAAGGVFSAQAGLDGTGELRSGLGLDLSGLGESNERQLSIDPLKLSKALRSDDGELIGLLFGDEDGGGLVESLRSSIAAAAEMLQQRNDRDNGLGLQVDFRA